MSRKEKIQIAISKGYTYNPITGEVRCGKQKVCKTITSQGYYVISFGCNNKKSFNLYQHQFAYYITHNKIVECIDHIDRNKLNNKIENLREVTKQQNSFNREAKGYSFNKKSQKYEAYIRINSNRIHLGLFNNQEDAHNAYLNAKKIYHKIN
jgi:hypothetical protein